MDLLILLFLAIPAFANPVQVKRFPVSNSGHLQSRQLQCIQQGAPCVSIYPAISCTTAECICPILKAAGSAVINTCASCLQSTRATEASELVLLGSVCSMCDSQCSSVINAIIQAYTECQALTGTCACPIIIAPGSAYYTTCASCIRAFDASGAS